MSLRVAFDLDGTIADMESALGNRAAALGHLESSATILRGIDTLVARIGLGEVLGALSTLRPEEACALHSEALVAWRARPLPTAYFRRVDTRLAARACR